MSTVSGMVTARLATRLPRGHVGTTLRSPGFVRLLTTRLAGQFGDGVFQASLAGAVLFNPERQAHAADVAAAFAVLLVPYSLIGPFAGVLLDRWWRQRVLVGANLVRVVAVLGVAAEILTGVQGEAFYASALVVLAVSRFFLAALSAALPHVVGTDELVTANAISTTLGGLATTAGGGAAIGIRLFTGDSSDVAYATMAAGSVLPFLASACVAAGFARTVLGPDADERAARENAAAVARGLVAGARHLYARRPAFLAIAAIAVNRLCYGLWLVCTVLLYRNYFAPDGMLRSGVAGLAQFLVVLGIGSAAAALATPPMSRRLGFVRWTVLLFAASAVVEVVGVVPYQLGPYLISALLLAFAAQSVKLCVDTQVQRLVADEFRGRVFALYDAVFNLAVVVAAAVTAVAVPPDGRAPAAALVLGAIYLLTAATYLHLAGARPVSAAAARTTG